MSRDVQRECKLEVFGQWPISLWNLNAILDKYFSSLSLWLIAEVSLVKWPSDKKISLYLIVECLSQHWFR